LEETPLEGEVYVSIDKTIEQANDYDVSIKDELLRLISHGVLHLVGYNDTTENEKNSMHKLENKYIELSKKK
jgi:rRNA maturation RNase YbeY